MKIFSKLLFTAFVVLFCKSSASAANLDVMIVYSDDSGLSFFDKTVVAGRYQLALSAVYGDPIIGVTGQLDGVNSVEVWPLMTPEMSYNAANKSNAEALQWMVSQNSNLLSPLRVGRELLGNPGADLIIMVVPGTTDNDCGAATNIPLTTDTAHSESNAFAIVVLEDTDPDCLEEIVIPHEVGHLLYAEHDTDTNGDDLLPSYKNHATTNSNGTLKSLMWDGLSPQGTEYLSGYLGGMTTAWADNVDFMSDDSYDVVAAYRAPPPPDCDIGVTWMCTNNSPHAIVTPTLAGFGMANIEMNYQPSGSSNWFSIYNGAPTCPIYNPPSNFLSSTVSALVTTAAGLVSGCSVIVVPITCDEDGLPGGL